MSDEDYLYVPSLDHLRQNNNPPATTPAPLPHGNAYQPPPPGNYSKRPRAGEPGEPPTPFVVEWQRRSLAAMTNNEQQRDTPSLAQHTPQPTPAMQSTPNRPPEHVEAMYAALREKYNVIQWQKDMIERGYQNGTDPHTIAVSIRTKIREGRVWKLGNMAQQQGDRDHPIRSVRTASGLSRPGDASETIVLLVTFGNPEIK